MLAIRTTVVLILLLKLEPRFPTNWNQAAFSFCLPSGTRLDVQYHSTANQSTLEVKGADKLPITLVLPWPRSGEPKIEGEGLASSTFEKQAATGRVRATMVGKGRLRLSWGT